MEGKGLTPLLDIARNRSRIKSTIATACAAEFLGTFILCLFGVGAGCQAFVTQIYVGIPLAGGVIGLMVAIVIVGGASGGHINPAVTFGVAICGGISWILVPMYWGAQFFGAYLGSGLAWSLYKSKLKQLCTSGDISTCKEFATAFAPMPHNDVTIALMDQIVGTALLVGVIIASVDQRNMKIPSYCFPPFFALTIFGINCALGVNAGGVLNPARDIGARLMAITVGYSADDVFLSQENEHYWLAPFFGPLLGGAVAAIVYIYIIGAHLTDDSDEDLKSKRYKVSNPALHDYE